MKKPTLTIRKLESKEGTDIIIGMNSDLADGDDSWVDGGIADFEAMENDKSKKMRLRTMGVIRSKMVFFHPASRSGVT